MPIADGDLDEARRVVSRSGWLVGRPAAFRRSLLAHARLLRFEKGEVIFRVGDPPGGIYGLVSGALRVEALTGNVGEQIACVGYPGFWIGVAAALHRHERKTSLLCITESSLLHVSRSRIEAMARDTEALRQLSTLLGENMEFAIAIARDLMNPDTGARIASRILAFVGPAPKAGVAVSLTQAELAAVCRVARKSINQQLMRLETAGAISRAYGHLTVENPARLAEIAAHGCQEFTAVAGRRR